MPTPSSRSRKNETQQGSKTLQTSESSLLRWLTRFVCIPLILAIVALVHVNSAKPPKSDLEQLRNEVSVQRQQIIQLKPKVVLAELEPELREFEAAIENANRSPSFSDATHL